MKRGEESAVFVCFCRRAGDVAKTIFCKENCLRTCSNVCCIRGETQGKNGNWCIGDGCGGALIAMR